MAAETELVISEGKLRELFALLYEEQCRVVRITYDRNPDKTILSLTDVWEDVVKISCQFLLKHSSFAKDDFKIRETNNIHMGPIIVLETFSGEGHIKLSTFPSKFSKDSAFELSVGYGSFFIKDNGDHVGPSKELKRYYKNLVNFLKTKCRRIEIFSGRFVWFEKKLLENDPTLLSMIKHSYGVEPIH